MFISFFLLYNTSNFSIHHIIDSFVSLTTEDFVATVVAVVVVVVVVVEDVSVVAPVISVFAVGSALDIIIDFICVRMLSNRSSPV